MESRFHFSDNEVFYEGHSLRVLLSDLRKAYILDHPCKDGNGNWEASHLSMPQLQIELLYRHYLREYPAREGQTLEQFVADGVMGMQLSCGTEGIRLWNPQADAETVLDLTGLVLAEFTPLPVEPAVPAN